MIKIQGNKSLEVDSARYYLEAILTLRDRFNVQSSLTISAQGRDICVAICVLELLKKQFPKNQFNIETSGDLEDVQDCNESTMTITFQVLEFQPSSEQPYFYVQKYLQHLIEYEQKQKLKIEQNNPQPNQQNKKTKNERIPKNYQGDELETEGLHGFAEAFSNVANKEQAQNRRERRERREDDQFQKGEVKTRGQRRNQ